MTISAQATLVRLLTTAQLQAEWFEANLLIQTPLLQIQQMIAGFKTDFGTYQYSYPLGERFAGKPYRNHFVYSVVFERGRVIALITLDNSRQISGLIFQPAPFGLDATIEHLKTFSGQINGLVLANGSELAAVEADRPLAVGSALTLPILAALFRQIRLGQCAWDDVVALQAGWKSRSGPLQNWPVGTHMTLETLATLMIVSRDNTATDGLIHWLSRAEIEDVAPLNRPFLTTQNLCILRAPQNAALLAHYCRLTSAQAKRQLLAEWDNSGWIGRGETAQTNVDQLNRPLNQLPQISQVGHFFTPRQLCGLMAEVAELPIMAVNPGAFIDRADWLDVAYQGGADLGVLSLNYQLVAHSGTVYHISITWNDCGVLVLDKLRLHTLCAALIQDLARSER